MKYEAQFAETITLRGHMGDVIDASQYRVHAAVDGWKRVFAWFEKYLKSPTH